MIRTLADSIDLAQSFDGAKLPLFVVDWGEVGALFDREGLWAAERLAEWLAARPNPAVLVAPLLQVRYATPRLLQVWEAAGLDDATRAYRRMVASYGAWSGKLLEAFRASEDSVIEEVPSGRDVTYVRPLRLHAPTREVPLAVVVLVDVPAERAHEIEIRHSAARYQAILEDQTDFIVRYRPDGVRTYVNRAYAEYFGGTPEELVGASFLPFIAPDHRLAVEDKVRRLVEREMDVASDEHLSYRSDGVLCWTNWVDRAIFDSHGNLVELQAVGRDVTERKEAEQRRLELERSLAHAHKMEAIGALAGGLAHDFNNTLTSIQGYASLIAADLTDASRVGEYARCLMEATARAAELTAKLLRLGRRAPRAVADFDVRSTVDTAVRLLRGALPDRIELRTEVPALPELRGDADELTQAIVNLGLNSRDAIAERGVIEIDARGVAEDVGDQVAEDAGDQVAEDARDHVVVRVRDDGCGIPEHLLSRVFEPFFTTKATGEGSGLGLAMVYSCAKAFGGRVEIASEPGRGTTVELHLPCRPGAAADSAES